MRFVSILFVSLAVLLLQGCASIFNGIGPESVQIQSTPPGAKCEIRSAESDTVISTITTPGVVMLEKKFGFFRPAHYRVLCSLEKREPREVSVDGRISAWYFGNIAIGGALGMGLIDPATGGMWTLTPRTVSVDYDTPSKSILNDVFQHVEDKGNDKVGSAKGATEVPTNGN
jgi:hypothetical protein